jgi:hypothetical protein
MYLFHILSYLHPRFYFHPTGGPRWGPCCRGPWTGCGNLPSGLQLSETPGPVLHPDMHQAINPPCNP